MKGAQQRSGHSPHHPKLRQIVVEAVFRQKRIFLTTALLVLAAVAALITFMPREYKAEAKLMVQNVRSATPLSATAPEHTSSQDEVSQSEINSEVDLLQSPMVARRVLGAPISGVQSRRTEQQMAELKHRLTVEAVHQTSLINLTYTGPSPDGSNHGLQKIIDAYFETRAGNARASGAAGFFDRELDSARKDLETGQKALTDYGLKHDITELDDEKKLQLARVSTLQDQISQADALIALQRSRQQRQQQQLGNTPVRSRTVERVITNQYSQERLNTSLVDLQNRRAELVRRYAPSDRQILELDDKIANTELAIKDAAARPASETATDVNPVWQQLSAAVAMSAGELSGAAAQRSTLQHQFDSAQARLDALERSTADVNALKRNLAQAQTEYELYSHRKSDADVSAELDKEKLFNVSLVQPPFSTNDPVRPRPLLYSVTGLVFALLLGTFFAVYADTSSGFVYAPGQLDTLTGSRTLATLAAADDPHTAEMNALEYRRLLFSMEKALGDRQSEIPGANNLLSGLDTPHGDWTGAASSGTGIYGNTTYGNTTYARNSGAYNTGSYGTPDPYATESSPYATRPYATSNYGNQPPVLTPPDSHIVAFTSSTRGEGVSYVAHHLAAEAARQFGSHVAVLDMRSMLRRFQENRGSETAYFGFKFLADEGYWVLAGSGEPVDNLRELGTRGAFVSRLCPWLLRAREDMDLILLDCPSNLESTISSELEACIDGYVAIVAAGQARKPSIDQLGAVLTDRRAPLLGYVLNRRRYPIPRWLHRLI